MIFKILLINCNRLLRSSTQSYIFSVRILINIIIICCCFLPVSNMHLGYIIFLWLFVGYGWSRHQPEQHHKMVTETHPFQRQRQQTEWMQMNICGVLNGRYFFILLLYKIPKWNEIKKRTGTIGQYRVK